MKAEKSVIISMVKKILQHFMKKNYKRLVKKNSRKKVINYMSNGKVMIVHLIVGLIKKTQLINGILSNEIPLV